MFGKLLKHEWKATAPLLLFLSGCMIAVSLLTVASLRLYLADLMYGFGKGQFSGMLLVILLVVVLFAVLSLAVYMLSINLVMLLQFYRSRFSDQGYLTFTLPVKPSQIFLASALHMYLWNIIAYLVIAMAFFIVWLLGVPWDAILISNPWEIITEFAQMYSLFGKPEGMEWLMRLLQFFYIPIACMTAIVVSCSLVRRHRGLVAIALMLLSQLPNRIYSVFVGVLNGLYLPSTVPDTDPNILPPLVFSVILAALAVGYYFLSVHLMQKKLNLA